MIKHLLVALALLAPLPAFGQTNTIINYRGATGGVQVSTTNPLPVTGSISASLAPFQPSASAARGTPLTVTTSDSSGALPTGAVVAVSNVGTTNPMYCNVNGNTATAADQYIAPSGGWFAFTIPSGVTTLHCIATGGSTTANTVGGTGLPAGTGGGSGGGGGGGTVDQGTQGSSASPWWVDTPPTGNLISAIESPIPGQSNSTTLIGQVGGAVNATNTDCSAALTTGGTAQNLITAGSTLHGFTVANIDPSTGSGEPVWISFTGTAVAGAIGSYPLAAPTATTFAGLSSYTSPFGNGFNGNLSVIAATTGHKISCAKW